MSPVFERKWKPDLERSGNKTDFYRIYILSSSPLLCTADRVEWGREAVALHSLWGSREGGKERRIPQTIGTGSDFMQSESIPPSFPSPYTFDNPIPSSNKPRLGDKEVGAPSCENFALRFHFVRGEKASARRYVSCTETRPPSSLVSINNARPPRKTNVEAAPIYCPAEQTCRAGIFHRGCVSL